MDCLSFVDGQPLISEILCGLSPFCGRSMFNLCDSSWIVSFVDGQPLISGIFRGLYLFCRQ